MEQEAIDMLHGGKVSFVRVRLLASGSFGSLTHCEFRRTEKNERHHLMKSGYMAVAIKSAHNSADIRSVCQAMIKKEGSILQVYKVNAAAACIAVQTTAARVLYLSIPRLSLNQVAAICTDR